MTISRPFRSSAALLILALAASTAAAETRPEAIFRLYADFQMASRLPSPELLDGTRWSCVEHYAVSFAGRYIDSFGPAQAFPAGGEIAFRQMGDRLTVEGLFARECWADGAQYKVTDHFSSRDFIERIRFVGERRLVIEKVATNLGLDALVIEAGKQSGAGPVAPASIGDAGAAVWSYAECVR
jgi:hypothetical protein